MTTVSFGRYHVDDTTIDRTGKVEDRKNSNAFVKTLFDEYGYKGDLMSLDGRLIIAAPLHLAIQSDETVIKKLYEEKMHISNNYGNGTGIGDYTYHDEVNDVATTNKPFKYMDVVMLSSSGYQYVIPFIVVDVKWLHNQSNDHYPTKTDNTYGHVTEKYNIKTGRIEYERINPMEVYLKFTKDGQHFNNEFRTIDDAIEMENGHPKIVNGEPKKVDISAIINKELRKFLFGSEYPKDKIVSMRLYDKQYDENNPNWWKNIRNGMQETTEKSYGDRYESKLHKGKVVKYE